MPRSSHRRPRIALAALVTLAFGCAHNGSTPESARASAQAGAQAGAQPSASASQTASEWRDLLAGGPAANWRAYKAQQLPAGWSMVGDTLTKEGEAEDLISRDQFGDFELTFDWKVAPGGNAGVFYRGTEEYDHIYWSAPEYQLLDDAKHPDGKSRLTSAGAAYALYPSPAGVVKAGGEWNSGRIVARGAHVEHWLNGQKMVDYELWSPDWEAKVRASKFNQFPNYGRAKSGYLGIQGDHPGKLEIRNLKIRVLH